MLQCSLVIRQPILTHWGRDKMAAISQTTFSNVFSSMKMFKFRLRFHWSLFPRVQLTIFHHWFRWWLGAVQATSHYLNQWWLVYRRIYASPGLNELTWCCIQHSDVKRRAESRLISQKAPQILLTGCAIPWPFSPIWRKSNISDLESLLYENAHWSCFYDLLFYMAIIQFNIILIQYHIHLTDHSSYTTSK